MHITTTEHRWSGGLGRRRGSPPLLIFHHAAASRASAEDIHRWHLSRGYRGIGYHFLVRKDGSVYRGRPEWAMGAHTLGHNDSLGVCAEGDYSRETMPSRQRKALLDLRAQIHRRYPGIVDRRHRDLNPTSCPGARFPWKQLTAPQVQKPPLKLTSHEVSIPRQKKPHRAGWWNFGLRPYIARLRREGKGDRVRAGNAPQVTIPRPVTRPRWWPKLQEWMRRNR